MSKTFKVTVVREVTETWEYVIDAAGLALPDPSKATPAEFGEACDAISDLIHGEGSVSGRLIESTPREESIDGWEREESIDGWEPVNDLLTHELCDQCGDILPRADLHEYDSPEEAVCEILCAPCAWGAEEQSRKPQDGPGSTQSTAKAPEDHDRPEAN